MNKQSGTNDPAWKRALYALLKAAGYYLAYRVLQRAAADLLAALLTPMREAGWLEGVSAATLNRLFSLGIHAVTATAIVLWFVMRRRPLLPSLGLTRLRKRLIPSVILCGCAANVTVSWLCNVIPFPSMWRETYGDRVGSLFAEYSVWTFVMTVIAAPLMEEIVFRGLIFKRLRTGLPFWAAATLSAAAFGLAHASLLWMLYAFALGFLLAWLTERTDSLWASVLCHFGFNLIGQISMGVLPLPQYVTVCAVGTLLLVMTVADVALRTKQAE